MNTDLAYWVHTNKDILKTKYMRIINDGLTESDLYFWLLYQASKIKIRLDMETEREHLSSQLHQLEKLIEDNRMPVGRDIIDYAQCPIHQEENHRT